MKNSSLLNAALEYTRRGKLVFPCGMDKKPLVKGGFKAASLNVIQIREWWQRWPEAMIGMPTGQVNGVLAIDCDGETGVRNFLSLCEQDGVTPDTTWQITPSGGRHYLFKMPVQDIRCSTSQLAQSVDIRATGGYIICAPSRREDGKSYEWQETAQISPLPDPLLERLLKLKNAKSVSKRLNPAPVAYVRKALEEEISNVKSASAGERNTILNNASFSLGQFVGANLLEQAIVENELLAAAEQCGLPQNEALRTIQSGLRAGILAPRVIPEKGIQVKAPVSTTPSQKTEWSEPVYFASFNLPQMKPEMLPPILGEYCAALSEEKQTPLELAACMSLVTLATAAQSSYKIRIRGDYCEPLNLYALCPLEPANRKTAIVSACSEPLLAWEEEQAKKIEPEIKRLKSAKQTIERAIEGRRAKAARAKDIYDIHHLQSEISDLEDTIPNIPNIPRLLADNTTPEALAALMEQMGGCISIMSGEGGIFDILAGMYSQAIPNLDLFLKGHCGEAFRVDRRMAPPILLNRPLISLGISPQPVTLTDKSASKIFRRRGLDGRFLYFMPESILGRRKLEPMAMPCEVKKRFHDKIHSLLPVEILEDRPEQVSLELSEVAYKIWLNFAGEVEKELVPGGGFEGMNDWGGKLPGAVARICGLFHLASHEKAWEMKIEPQSMQLAVELGHFLAEHAKAAYALMGADEKIEGAKRVLAWIKRTAKNTFSVRDCQQALKQQTMFNHVQAVKDALAELEERAFIREMPIEYMGYGRKPCAAYEVNPAVWG